MNASQQSADEVAERLFGSLLGTVEIMSGYLRDRLGWYPPASDGPASPVELAGRTGTQVRYAREWLEQRAGCSRTRARFEEQSGWVSARRRP